MVGLRRIQYFLFHDLSEQTPVSREGWKTLFSQAGFNSIGERYLGFARTDIYTLYWIPSTLWPIGTDGTTVKLCGTLIQTGGKQ